MQDVLRILVLVLDGVWISSHSSSSLSSLYLPPCIHHLLLTECTIFKTLQEANDRDAAGWIPCLSARACVCRVQLRSCSSSLLTTVPWPTTTIDAPIPFTGIAMEPAAAALPNAQGRSFFLQAKDRVNHDLAMAVHCSPDSQIHMIHAHLLQAYNSVPKPPLHNKSPHSDPPCSRKHFDPG